ncbi:MAG TPA: hypothetical protein VIK52_14780 [Opitutaceae bacterium]
MNDLLDGGSGDDSLSGDNAIVWRRGDSFGPRFRELTEEAIYTTGPDGETTGNLIVTNFDPVLHQVDPRGAVGRDVQILDHHDTVESTPLGRFGADIISGGPDDDVVYGELGNDLLQGDGNISLVQEVGVDEEGDAFFSYTVEVSDTVDPDETWYFNIPEDADSDGNDYIEGNGGSDLIFGGLGQDDIIGGSSNLFGLDTVNAVLLGYNGANLGEEMRPDGSDIIFGGAGVDIDRNDLGDADLFNDPLTAYVDNIIKTVPTGHAHDSDYIMGDNANLYRIVVQDTNPDPGALPTPDPLAGYAGDAFETFLYDYSFDAPQGSEDRGDERIVVRAMEQLDYVRGGSDFAWDGEYNVLGQAVIDGLADNGTGDLIHGEAGDDFIYGMTGSDVLYGDGQDDDIIGGYGNDWISGGTGQDGVIGDDGLVLTSRNSTDGEPLNGIAPLLDHDSSTKYSNGDALDETISTPGDLQIAVINVEGALKKSVDLVPFSYDPDWLALDDEFPDDDTNTPFADDVIFGGLGSDFLHGGSGDDAISGAEALLHAYVTTFDMDGNPDGVLDLGYDAVAALLSAPVLPGDLLGVDLNPGDVLAFNPVDLDGQHLNNRFRAGEFYYYDEYDPRRQIMLTPTGELYKEWSLASVVGVDYFEFVLNFDESEGVYRDGGNVPKATGQQTESYGPVNDDGKDAIFGDNGNDWLVGGTGRDNIYGGWGNDLLNADDKHSEIDDGTKEVTVSDTHPTFEDRAYGGAGRDVLIGNTGGDRLIDWVGEYNSYLVPYAEFGQASVSRTLQPFLPEYLYALSAGDGADFTRYTDAVSTDVPQPTNNNPNPSRNGEPHGELGLVLQKDFAWQDQTGAPADPQAGNIPGGHRDVLRSAGFNDGTSDGFFADSGTWAVKGGVLTVAPQTKGSAALSVFYVDDFIPSYFEMMATINAVKPTGGYKANAYIIFDYQSETDFKFAGIDVSNSKLVIGQRTEAGWTVVTQGVYPGSLKAGTNYNVFLALNGTNVILRVDNKVTLTYTFAPRIDDAGISYGLSHGMVGLGADNAKASIDNMVVQRLAPVMTFVRDVDFSSGLGDLFAAPAAGTWTLAAERYSGSASGSVPAINLFTPDPAPAAVIDLSTVLMTNGAGGFVFDYYNATAFKFAALDRVAGTITVGHRTAKGWFTDAVYTNAAIKTSADQTLGLTIKGTTVSVKLNNALVLSFAFNALATDGATGLLGRSGTTSFNSVKFQTDDPGIQAQAGTTTTGSSANYSMFSLATEVQVSGVAGIDRFATTQPALVTSTTSVARGPVLGSIVNDLLGTTAASTMVSGFSGTSSTLIPMVTSDITVGDRATISLATPLQTAIAGVTNRLTGAAAQGWTLASVTFDAEALQVSATGNTATESGQASTDPAEDTAEQQDVSSEIQAPASEADVDSIFGEQMMPPTSHGAVESRKTDEAQPDSEDDGAPGRSQPDAN